MLGCISRRTVEHGSTLQAPAPSLASVSAETIVPYRRQPVAESGDLPFPMLPMSSITAAAPPVSSPVVCCWPA